MRKEDGPLKESDVSLIREKVLDVIKQAVSNHQISWINETNGDFLSEDEIETIKSLVDIAKLPRQRRGLGRQNISPARSLLWSLQEDAFRDLAMGIEEHSKHSSTTILITDHPIKEDEVVANHGRKNTPSEIYDGIATMNMNRTSEGGSSPGSAIFVLFSPTEQIISPNDPPSTWRRKIELAPETLENSSNLYVKMTATGFNYTLHWQDDFYSSKDDQKKRLTQEEILRGLEEVQKTFKT